MSKTSNLKIIIGILFLGIFYLLFTIYTLKKEDKIFIEKHQREWLIKDKVQETLGTENLFLLKSSSAFSRIGNNIKFIEVYMINCSDKVFVKGLITKENNISVNDIHTELNYKKETK